MSFTNLESSVQPKEVALTLEQKNSILNEYSNGLGVTAIKHKLFIKSSQIKGVLDIIRSVSSTADRLMTEKPLLTKTSLKTAVKSALKYDDIFVDGIIDVRVAKATKAGTYVAYQNYFKTIEPMI